jgi:small subunit ribosomal protein S20
MKRTRSGQKEARKSLRRRARNQSVKSRLHTLERKFLSLLGEGKRDEAVALLGRLFSALDKAAKTGVIHRNVASRKKSRLSLRLAAKAA